MVVNINGIKTLVTSKVGRVVIKAHKHSPQILFVAGAVAVVSAAVLTARAAFKSVDVMDAHTEELNGIKLRSEIDDTRHEAGNTQEYTDDRRRQDLAMLYVRTGGQLAKNFALPVFVGAAGIAALTGSHVILNRRYAGVVAAYATLDKLFDQYRQRVINEYGPEKDRDFRYGLVERQIVEETDEGPVVKVVKERDVNGRSQYARCFDETSQRWSRQPGYNQIFLRTQQAYMNDLLRARGHLFLNEVYDALGFDHTPAGSVVGWIWDGCLGDGASDNYVDFDLFVNGWEYDAKRFINGDERSIWLDFNVDGVIYDKI